jgi:hypothetical protein
MLLNIVGCTKQPPQQRIAHSKMSVELRLRKPVLGNASFISKLTQKQIEM